MANSGKITDSQGTVYDEYDVNSLPSDVTVSDAYLTGSGVTNISNVSMEDYWITSSSIDWSISATPFIDCMPDLGRVNEMCEEYPALAKALENFKTVYAMVEQDWKGKNK